MINYDKVAEKIFAIIKGFGYDLSMFTIDGMDTSIPSDGRRFYVKKPNFMVTLDEETDEIKINKNSRVTLEEIESVMKQLKNLAKQNLLNTQVKVFGKEITPKDFAYQAKKFKDAAMENITNEASLSRMSGSKKTSYQTLESVKVIVRHRKPVAEDKRGARSRQIQAIFLEQGGERVRFPHNNLIGARAMARHMYEGGNFEDALGSYIVESVGSILKLNEFVRYARTNKLINETNEDVVKTVKENIATLRRELHGLTGAKTYARISEKIATREVDVLEEDDVTDLQDMFTVKKFDEKIGGTLPLIRRLMNEKQAWRNALIEASTQTILMHEKEELAEEDVMEFDNPVQQVGYKIQRVAKRMVETGDLQKFVGKVAGKLIEGQAINEFEKTVVRNVLENATIEEAKVCEECGELTCECNTFESVMEGYALKIKMIEHEDIFEAELNEKQPGKGYWDKFYGRKAYHDKKKGSVKEDERSEQFQKHSFDDCEACDGSGNVGDLECGECAGGGIITTRVEEGEGEKCIRCRKGTMQLGDTMMGPAKECDRCNYQVQVNKVDEDEDCPTCHGWGEVSTVGTDPRDISDFDSQERRNVKPCPDCKPVKEADFDDHHAGEVEAGAHSGMPSNDQIEAEADVQDVVDEVVSDVLSDPMRGHDEVLELVASHFQDYNDPLIDVAYGQVIDRLEAYKDEDDGQPSEYDEWQDYMGGDDWDHGQYDESRMLELAGVPIKEDDSEQCSECGGVGEVWGKACEKCGGEEAVDESVDPEDFMEDCPDCKGTGKAQDSIFDDAECSKCGGEGYV